MSRKPLLAVMLTLSICAFGQRSGGHGSAPAASAPAGTSVTQPGAPTTQGAVGGISGQAAAGQTLTPSANTAGTPTVPAAMAGPSGTTGTTQANPDTLNNGTPVTTGVVNGGFATGSGVLATPTGMFVAPAPTAGISDAGRAGISSSTPTDLGVVESSMGTSTMVLTNVPPVNPSPVNATAVAANTGRLINDMGPSFYSDVIARPNTVSLAEVAAQYKQARMGVNARMLTNDDVHQMVDNKTGVTTAANMPPLGPGATPSGAQSSTAPSPSQPQNAPAPAQTAQSGAPATQPAQAQPQTGATAQPSAAQGSTTAGAATTPQINPNQQSNDTQGKSKLPATATFLPLLGLLGLVSGGIGLLVRKFRK